MGAGVMIGRMTHGEFLIALSRHCDLSEAAIDISFPPTKSHTDNSPPDTGLDEAPMVQDDKAGEQ